MFHWGEYEQPVKAVLDWTSIGVLVGAFAQWLPSVAALLTVVWGGLRIYDAYLDIRIKRAQLRTDNTFIRNLKDAEKSNES